MAAATLAGSKLSDHRELVQHHKLATIFNLLHHCEFESTINAPPQTCRRRTMQLHAPPAHRDYPRRFAQP